MEEVLERQEREIRERRRRRAASKKAQRDLDQQLVMAVAILHEENQSSRGSHEGRAPNVDRHRHSREQKFTTVIRMLAYSVFADQVDEIARMGKSTAWESLGDYGNRNGQKSIILEAVPSFDTWVWHAFFGVAGSQNDLNVLGQSPVFTDVLRGEAPKITYEVNNTIYQTGYYLANGIYPRWTTFVKSLPHPRTQKQKLFATYQEGYRKDVERCFSILQARWAIIRGAARMFDDEVLRSIMMTCIILHNMIVEDEYDYEAEEVYEPDPMNTALTRIYEKPIGPNGGPVEHEPLVRDGLFMNHMIDRYTEMQSSYIHERCQVDLMEHLWVVKGNDGE
ncbi:PREDICTED: uncharacterized protein LOC103320449 [Prunus mume]|uniref:Uncharacterized protein LOC103320449 n=1 Tax=Prunus mume TaxID=102107 RepID=A0ABM0N6Q7_PRUMU|nr:PREDICTED: uncharacterized protein LOC103320449 [Prunus mume]